MFTQSQVKFDQNRTSHAGSSSGSRKGTLPLEEYKKVSPYFEADVYDALSLETCVGGRKVYGGPAPEAVRVQIDNLKAFVKEREAE